MYRTALHCTHHTCTRAASNGKGKLKKARYFDSRHDHVVCFYTPLAEKMSFEARPTYFSSYLQNAIWSLRGRTMA
jgi:hypothetical protein